MVIGNRQTRALFHATLGVQDPWYIVDYSFNTEEKKLILHIDFMEDSTALMWCVAR